MTKAKRIEKPMRPVKRSHGGVHPRHSKNAAECITKYLPLPELVYISMRQHIGAPCTPLVAVGDTVYVGQKIGDCDSPVSAPIHSGVSGEVVEICEIADTRGTPTQAVVIRPDGKQTDYPDLKPVTVNTAEELVKAARDCGLVGLGGAGFPTHVKLTPKDGQRIDTLIINAAECEPFITSDYRACMEDGKLIIEGVYTLLRCLDIDRIIIGVEDNKPKAIKELLTIAADARDQNNRIRVMKLPSHYPHGAEKILVQVATGRRIPPGALPASVGCAVMNITGVAVLQHYLNTGMPLTRRRVTVDGSAVKNPANFWVPVGTPVRDILAYPDLLAETPAKLIMGGPMMGTALMTADTPTFKSTNAILAFAAKDDLSDAVQKPCIRCGRCAAACPMSLMPTLIERFAKIGALDDLRRVGVGVCMECGSCAFSCPAHRPLVQYMRLAKEIERKGRDKS